MKIAITATAAWLHVPRCAPKFGRAQYFIVVDAAIGTHAVRDNSLNIESAQGAGIRVAELMSGLKLVW